MNAKKPPPARRSVTRESIQEDERFFKTARERDEWWNSEEQVNKRLKNRYSNTK